jgi:hypothetical protein
MVEQVEKMVYVVDWERNAAVHISVLFWNFKEGLR